MSANAILRSFLSLGEWSEAGAKEEQTNSTLALEPLFQAESRLLLLLLSRRLSLLRFPYPRGGSPVIVVFCSISKPPVVFPRF